MNVENSSIHNLKKTRATQMPFCGGKSQQINNFTIHTVNTALQEKD